MNYSDLNIDDRKMMIELSEKLNSATMLRESLLDELSPLKDELSELKKHISELNSQAQSLYNVIEGGERTIENTTQYSETLKEIDELEKKYVLVESNILKLKNKINPVLASENDIIEEMNNIKIKNNNKFELNEDGVIVIKEINNLGFKEEPKINTDKNIITQTKKNVCSFIKDKFGKSKNIEIHIVESLKEKLNKLYENSVKPTFEELREEFMTGYNSVRNEYKNDKIDEMLNQRKKVKEEAENLEFVDNPTKTETNEVSEKFQLEDKESKEEGFVYVEEPEINSPSVQDEEILSKNSKEVENAAYIESEIVEDKKEKNTNIFMSTPIKDNNSNEFEQTISGENELSSFDKMEHFIKDSNNKVAKAAKPKVETMITIFSSLPKYIDKIFDNNQNDIEQREEQKKLLQAQKLQMQKLNEQYASDVENIFTNRNMIA